MLNCGTVTGILCITPSNDGSIFQNLSKAPDEAWICWTPLSWSWTLSPPEHASPQVTIALSPWHHKAKALFVAASCGWSTRAVRHSPSSISASSKVCLKLTQIRFLAVISLRYFFPRIPRACWQSLTLEAWKKAELWEVQHAHSAKLHLSSTLSWDILKTSAMLHLEPKPSDDTWSATVFWKSS